jgi:hypothetical protein
VPAKVIALNRCGLMHTWSYSHDPTYPVNHYITTHQTAKCVLITFF